MGNHRAEKRAFSWTRRQPADTECGLGYPQQLRIAGAELNMVRILRYERTSIAQIAWLHADYGPMALCISPALHDTNPIAREQRHGMQLAWWPHDGYQYVLIGRNPSAQRASTAEALQAALT